MSLREEILQEGRILQNQEDIQYFLEENMRDEAENLYEKVTSIQDIECLGQLMRDSGELKGRNKKDDKGRKSVMYGS